MKRAGFTHQRPGSRAPNWGCFLPPTAPAPHGHTHTGTACLSRLLGHPTGPSAPSPSGTASTLSKGCDLFIYQLPCVITVAEDTADKINHPGVESRGRKVGCCLPTGTLDLSLISIPVGLPGGAAERGWSQPQRPRQHGKVPPKGLCPPGPRIFGQSPAETKEASLALHTAPPKAAISS